MRFRKALTFLILATVLVFALPAWAQQKSVGPSGAGPRPNAVRPYVACAAAMPALPPRAQQKLFTQEQVSNMVRDGFGGESGAKLIEQRGIDFAPAEDFMQSLQAAGASEAFLKALRAAKPPEPAGYHRTTELGLVFLLAGPTRLFFLIRMQSPESNSPVAGPNDLTQPVRLCLKLRMAEETADETCCLVCAHGQTNDAVMGMAKRLTVKPQIASEKCRAFHSVQERDDLLILHAGAPDLMSYLADPNAPAAQQLPLIFRNVLIEYVHLTAGTSSSLWFIRTSRASRTDSAMASWRRAPRQFSMIASQAMPLAT